MRFLETENRDFIHLASGQTVTVYDISPWFENSPCGCCSEQRGETVYFRNTIGEDDFEKIDFDESFSDYFKEI